MQYRKLGRTGLKVSAICLGTMIYGNQVGETESIKIIERALDAGVNFLDTADSYIAGKSEEVVGKALKGKRQSVVLATKVGFSMGPSISDSGLSRKHIMQAVEASLRRLNTNYIDIYYAHRPDYETPIEETLRAMDNLIQQGKVRYIACSNFTAWQLCKALWVSDLHNLARFECISSPYNLLTRDIGHELLPLCASEEIGVCVYNPLAGGLLTGKYDFNKTPKAGTRFTLNYKSDQGKIGEMYRSRYWSEINFNAVANLRRTAKEHGRSLPQFALAWTLANKTITTAICGATSPEQLEENIGAIEVKLTDEELAACDSVWQQIRPPRFFYGI